MMKSPAFTEKAQSMLKHLLVDDPEIEHRIETGIEQHRKGWGEIKLVDKEGEPVEHASVSMRQMKHEFHFGCNAFLLDQLPEAEKNAQYRELFSDVFNLAVVPFYWADLEPEEGKMRFDKNSPFIYRRPPPDLVLDFCEEKGITPKAHPLLWHNFRPEWLGCEEMEMRRHIRRRFQAISERYAHRINIWDVCNEVQTLTLNQKRAHMPENHLEYAFELAAKFFPNGIKTYNDDRIWYRYSRSYSPVYLLVKSLIEQGYKVDALGLQLHMFTNVLYNAFRFLNQKNLLDSFDLYGRLGVPLNISEISLISSKDLGDGDAFQEILTDKLYRLWFSHAAMNGIVWWNMVDNTAAYAPLGDETAGENVGRAGLVNYDMTPKPAYKVLKRLIQEEWQTNPSFEYTEGAANKFRGFYGDYEVTVKTAQGTSIHKIKHSRNNLNVFMLKL
ncbi:endo-1,4-beta-xylanase [Coraliomargarita algicola]|uniref:Endo-1,4-beta-xylanase n=1 Tax=Coraliomargarita algicola TaxID=3092156 RepID=A0ABZ0RHW3_9BACT|nr:endo-1,4-beta-xylanase [Coraliomargarita sp. J2-16]WPJ95058.1 endo-1,4-beta-xylanase [Coraliomargarita sp. J2-16]